MNEGYNIMDKNNIKGNTDDIKEMHDIRIGDIVYSKEDGSRHKVVDINTMYFMYLLEKIDNERQLIHCFSYDDMLAKFSFTKYTPMYVDKPISVEKRYKIGDTLYSIIGCHRYTICDIYVAEEHGTVIEVFNNNISQPLAYPVDVVQQIFTKEQPRYGTKLNEFPTL